MKPQRIIIVRHGQSEGNVDKTIYAKIPDYQIALTPEGVKQADTAGKVLKNLIGGETVYFYVSPFKRTRQTYQEIAKYFPDSENSEDPRLIEQSWGGLRSHNITNELEKIRNSYGTFYFKFPDGESCLDVYTRVSGFIDTLHRDFQNEYKDVDNVIIVMHGMSMRLLLMKWFHWTVEQFENVRNPKNAAFVVLKLQEDGKYKLATQLNLRDKGENFDY